jgi:hypothetical protein
MLFAVTVVKVLMGKEEMEGCGADDRGGYGVKESCMFISESIFDRED